MKVSDLRDREPSGVMLYCRVCGAEWSAWRGDYFWALPDTVLKCCDVPCVRVRKATRLVKA